MSSPRQLLISNVRLKGRRGQKEPPTASSVATIVPGPGMTGPCTEMSPAFNVLHSIQGTHGWPLATTN